MPGDDVGEEDFLLDGISKLAFDLYIRDFNPLTRARATGNNY